MTYQHIDRSDSANQPQSGRHAGTCKRFEWSRWAQVTALAVALSFLGAFFLGTVAPAQASVLNPHAVSWQAEAHSALLRFEHGGGTVALDRLVTDGFHLPARYGQADIDQLAADVLGGAKAKYITEDEACVDQDLTQLMLPMAS